MKTSLRKLALSLRSHIFCGFGTNILETRVHVATCKYKFSDLIVSIQIYTALLNVPNTIALPVSLLICFSASSNLRSKCVVRMYISMSCQPTQTSICRQPLDSHLRTQSHSLQRFQCRSSTLVVDWSLVAVVSSL